MKLHHQSYYYLFGWGGGGGGGGGEGGWRGRGTELTTGLLESSLCQLPDVLLAGARMWVVRIQCDGELYITFGILASLMVKR